MPVHIAPFQTTDRPAWETLARGYKAFYETPTSDAEFDQTWQRLLAQDGVYGLGALSSGQLVGIAHYLFHPTTWAAPSCYLQDLFTAPAARGQGVATALIDAVAAQARARRCARFYWLTRVENTPARALYDRVAAHKGFIRYDFTL